MAKGVDRPAPAHQPTEDDHPDDRPEVHERASPCWVASAVDQMGFPPA
jgi:hypothetical protein